MTKKLLALSVNGRRHERAASDNLLLLELLRSELGLTGTKQGCDGGECGACTVLVDGAPQLACLTLAASCAGKQVETIEGLAVGGRIGRLQQAFHEHLGTQCGFCTPGMVMTSVLLLKDKPGATEQDIREGLEGNICRCTGYHNIVKSIQLCQSGKADATATAAT